MLNHEKKNNLKLLIFNIVKFQYNKFNLFVLKSKWMKLIDVSSKRVIYCI